MRVLRHGALFLVLLGLACAGSSATQLPGAARSESALFWVENHGKDERQLEQIIANALEARGLNAGGGELGSRPENADYVVTYTDRWFWDMRTYLGEIKIDVTDVKTGEVVATSRKYQTSMPAMGKTYEEIVRAATNQLLDGAP